MAKLNLHYPRGGGLTNAQIAALAEDWADDLRQYSMPVIRAAVKMCRTDEERHYFPSIGELIAYCRLAQGDLERWQKRTDNALPCHEQPAEKPEISDATRDLIARTKAKLAARMTA